MLEKLTPQTLLHGYAAGVFPMAEGRGSTDIHWVDPNRRGLFDLDRFHMSRSLRKAILNRNYQARFNSDFEAVLNACADRSETWINSEIHDLYMGLHALGHAHSQEIWTGDQLIGGVYGVTLGGAFFGESMFSHQRDGSKIALAWLVDRLRFGGFCLFDTQFVTPHLARLGAIEISRTDYLKRLEKALSSKAEIEALPAGTTAQDVIQRSTQTS